VPGRRLVLSRTSGVAGESSTRPLAQAEEEPAPTTSRLLVWTSRERATAASVDYCNRLQERACAAALVVLLPIVPSDSPRRSVLDACIRVGERERVVS
jgi:hypothetical protein